MDAFYASVEQLDNPELRSKPVAVGGSRQRGVVAAASYEARRFGVRSAQSSIQAARLCPDIIFVKPRFERYKEVSEQIRNIFHEYTPLVEPLSLDEAFLDVTRNNKGMESATLIAREIRSRILEETGLTASAGVSVNKFLAKVASDIHKPDGLTLIPPANVEQFVSELPIEKFFGIGKVTAEKFKSLGVFTGKDLKEFSRPELVKLFGKAGRYYYDISRGVDERAVKPDRVRKSVGAEQTFNEDLESEDLLLLRIEKLAQTVSSRMKNGGYKGRTISVKLRYSDFSTFSRSQSIEDFTDDFDQIREIATQLFKEHPREQAFRLLGITVSNLNTAEELREHGQLTMKL